MIGVLLSFPALALICVIWVSAVTDITEGKLKGELREGAVVGFWLSGVSACLLVAGMFLR